MSRRGRDGWIGRVSVLEARDGADLRRVEAIPRFCHERRLLAQRDEATDVSISRSSLPRCGTWTERHVQEAVDGPMVIVIMRMVRTRQPGAGLGLAAIRREECHACAVRGSLSMSTRIANRESS